MCQFGNSHCHAESGHSPDSEVLVGAGRRGIASQYLDHLEAEDHWRGGDRAAGKRYKIRTPNCRPLDWERFVPGKFLQVCYMKDNIGYESVCPNIV